MNVKRSGSQPSKKGPAETFTGTVRIDPLFQADDPGRALGVSVTFEPGARTAWHTHPLGQTLIVTSGCGLVQSWGGPVEELRAEALAATPPREEGSFRPSDLVEVISLDPTIRLDIRYATPNNFLGTPLYEETRAF